MASYITSEVYEHAKTLKTKIGKKVFDALDTESISGIVLAGDTKTFWFEHNQYHDYVSAAVYAWIKNYLNKQGYTYLYAEDEK